MYAIMKSKGHEEWRKYRRENWSEHRGYYITSEIRDRVKDATGLNHDILTYTSDDTPLQLWIDNIVDKLMLCYDRVIKQYPETYYKKPYSELLHLIGFSKECLSRFPDVDDELSGHFMLYQIVENIINAVLRV